MSALIALGRHVGTASLAGAITGIVVGGVLGRIVMRIAGFVAGPALVGSFTANNNRVGDVTFVGTAALMIFVGLSAGLSGGVVYAVLEPWLRRLRPWHGLAYGAGLLATVGFSVLDPANLDFRRFGSAPLNVAMFAALFLAFGIGVAWLFDRLRELIAGTGKAARIAEILAWVALGLGAVVTVLVLGAVTDLTGPLFPILSVTALLIAAFARWRRLPTSIGYTALAAAVLLGAARTVGGLSELLAAL